MLYRELIANYNIKHCTNAECRVVVLDLAFFYYKCSKDFLPRPVPIHTAELDDDDDDDVEYVATFKAPKKKKGVISCF